MIPLVASHLKLAGLVSFIVFSGVAIPTSVIAVNENVRDGIKGYLDPVKKALEGIPELLKTNIWEPGKQVYSQYQDWGKAINLSDKFSKENAKVGLSSFEQMATFLANSKSFLEKRSDIAQKAESFNYYLFHFSGLIKKVLSYIPRIPGDTIMSMLKKQHSMQGLINIKKLVSLSEAHGKKEMVAQLMTLYSKKSQAFEKLKDEDIDELFKVIESLDETNVDTLWQQIEKNAKEIENDSSKDYSKDNDSLIKDLLVSDKDKSKLTSELNEIKSSIDSIKDPLTGAGLGQDQLDSFKNFLTELLTKLTPAATQS